LQDHREISWPNRSSKERHSALVPEPTILREFETLAREAKRVGFTHVFISDLAEKATYWGAEKDSPWCEWSAVIPCVFKHVTVPGMEDAYPAAWVKRQMAFMKAKHKIAQKLGMRAAYYGLEPHFFPEPVYDKHPQWRGSRADNSLRATGMYFTPNTNHPEVLALYRAAYKKLAEECPLLDVFHLHTNDCGAFYPWGKRLFNGPTAPLVTRTATWASRSSNFCARCVRARRMAAWTRAFSVRCTAGLTMTKRNWCCANSSRASG